MDTERSERKVLPSAWALNSRQGAAAERRACAREKRTCAQEAERSERKSFLWYVRRTYSPSFSKKVRPCPYRRAAHEKKLGKQGLCPAFPGRRSARKVAARSPLRHAFGMTPPPKGEARLGSPFGGAGTAAAVTERASSRDAVAVRRLRGPTQSCPRAEDRKMALLGSNPHKTWVFEQCHVALFVEIALLLCFKLLKQTPSESRFLRFELCHFPLNCAMWHCSQSRINTGFFANSAKFSSQAVGRREGRSLLGEIDKFEKIKKRPATGRKLFPAYGADVC